ncbi:MAG: isopentenyl phosphate kinase [Thermoplasmata archaeon]|nr:isopentenyl phosphate kinase [Thermoplasmata archaeon]
MQIIKLGGSVITDKKRYCRFRKQVVGKIAGELKRAADAGEKFVIVHGAGSFGHIKAREYQLNLGRNPKIGDQHLGFARVHLDVRTLNLKIMECLNKHGISAVSLPPLSIALNSAGKLKVLDVGAFERALSNSLVPVTFGDVVFDEKLGFSICSGDDLTLKLGAHFLPERVIFVCDVPGVYADFPPKKHTAILKEISPSDISNLSKANPEFDVTGGIFGKIQKCFTFLEERKTTEIWVISGRNFDNFRNALIGKDIQGTKVVIK